MGESLVLKILNLCKVHFVKALIWIIDEYFFIITVVKSNEPFTLSYEAWIQSKLPFMVVFFSTNQLVIYLNYFLKNPRDRDKKSMFVLHVGYLNIWIL